MKCISIRSYESLLQHIDLLPKKLNKEYYKALNNSLTKATKNSQKSTIIMGTVKIRWRNSYELEVMKTELSTNHLFLIRKY